MSNRNAFYSFHYVPDNWRAGQVRNMDVVDGNHPVSDNDWEEITKGGDKAIEKWIKDQMVGRSCVVVLIGKDTANRKWINHEIVTGWNSGKGVVGIYIHNLKNVATQQSSQGLNPFDFINFKETKLSSVVKAFNPPYSDSQKVYAHIKDNIGAWIEDAIKIRNNN